MKWVKGKYEFDMCDITTAITVCAVALTMLGYGFIATIIFVVNCSFQIVWTFVKVKRYNLLILNIALLIFNLYFLK